VGGGAQEPVPNVSSRRTRIAARRHVNPAARLRACVRAAERGRFIWSNNL